LNANRDGVASYNKIGVEYEKLHPNDTAAWIAAGYEVTKEEAETIPAPDAVTNCTMEQGKYPKQAVITFKPAPNSINFTLEITNDNPLDATKYIQVKNPRMIFTTIKIEFFVPDAMLDKILYVKVTAHNHGGDSPASDPFGGRKIQ